MTLLEAAPEAARDGSTIIHMDEPFLMGPPADDREGAHVLWYDRPAKRWHEALPLGNGVQGLMVFGDPGRERILLNDSTCWSGSPDSESRPPLVDAETAAQSIAEARAAIDRGVASDASAALRRLQHRHTQAFVPLGELGIEVGNASVALGYERRLDLRTATHDTRSVHPDGTRHTRIWASHPDRVVVVELRLSARGGERVEVSASSALRLLGRDRVRRRGRTEAALRLQLPSDVAPPHDEVQPPIEWDGSPGAALRAAIVLSWTHDGIEVEPAGDNGVLAATGVTRATVVVATATTYVGMRRPPLGDDRTAAATARDAVDRVFARGTPPTRERQLADHRELYARAHVVTGPGSVLPLDRRVGADTAVQRVASDPGLAGLLFNFGRYLLIASSRPGAPPANLQGIWNDHLRPPWSSNYTTNINLPMNYWQTEVARLPELADPLFDLIDALAERGTETARTLYAARGWVAHHNSDAWAYTSPVGHGTHDPMWAFWPFGGPWLVQHLGARLDFLHVDDPARVAFARNRVLDVVRGASVFLLDWMTTEADGSLGTSPSSSPENQFLDAAGHPASVGRSSTLDLTLARETFLLLVRAAEIAGVADDLVVEAARSALERIPPVSAGAGDRVREWADDPVEVDPTHRHQSHLWFVYPGSRPLTPQLAAAAAASLDRRGPESTGWALAWRLALRARLRQPREVGVLLENLFRDMSVDRGALVGGIYPNLFTAHPPFQIDANLGYVAALAECLMQSRDGLIELLPALPPALASGSAIGLAARGGVVVDVEWSDGVLTRVRLRATSPVRTRVRCAAAEATVDIAESAVEFDGRLHPFSDTDGCTAPASR